jgi:hypothetical protein
MKLHNVSKPLLYRVGSFYFKNNKRFIHGGVGREDDTIVFSGMVMSFWPPWLQTHNRSRDTQNHLKLKTILLLYTVCIDVVTCVINCDFFHFNDWRIWNIEFSLHLWLFKGMEIYNEHYWVEVTLLIFVYIQ